MSYTSHIKRDDIMQYPNKVHEDATSLSTTLAAGIMGAIFISLVDSPNFSFFGPELQNLNIALGAITNVAVGAVAGVMVEQSNGFVGKSIQKGHSFLANNFPWFSKPVDEPKFEFSARNYLDGYRGDTALALDSQMGNITHQVKEWCHGFSHDGLSEHGQKHWDVLRRSLTLYAYVHEMGPRKLLNTQSEEAYSELLTKYADAQQVLTQDIQKWTTELQSGMGEFHLAPSSDNEEKMIAQSTRIREHVVAMKEVLSIVQERPPQQLGLRPDTPLAYGMI